MGLAAEGLLRLGELEDVVEAVVEVPEPAQAVADPCRRSGAGGGPRVKVGDLVPELGDQRVGSARKTD